jgi:LCP family protein required for cell wall assembly
VIIFVLLPGDGGPPVMVSLPRDLYVRSPCSGQDERINANLNGCGAVATGPELLAIAVEDFTGIPVDHYIEFDFDGFTAVIDRLGGIEVCVDNPVRAESGEPQLFPAGCTVADGERMLVWIRSRSTQELVDGRWRTMPGVNDLERNRRQRDLLIEMVAKLQDFRSITEFSRIVDDLSSAFTLDEGMTLGSAIGTAWELRGLDPGLVLQPEIPVSDYVTAAGAYVLIPEASFEEVLVSASPATQWWFEAAG